MRSINLVFLIMLMTTTLAAQTPTKEQRAVQQTIENMFTALSHSDTSALKMYVTEDVNFFEYGQIWNRDTIVHKALLGKTIPDFKRINSFEYVSTNINQKTAWVTYYLQSTITKRGKEEIVKWLETVILIRNGNQWKINVLHSTRLGTR
ncbi:MAG TPA: nuclear transport factor 2 family protein [Cyclobacteriaceae bacterium]|nr:nuclear transport factor 2 family protein [Cyclobacteriaceae bacterium]